MYTRPLSSRDFKDGSYYKVFFERDSPIEFKFVGDAEKGDLSCELRDGKRFDFNTVEQFTRIETVENA